MSLPLDICSKNGDASLGTLEKQLICPICEEVFTKPVVILPCLHNLCRKCANELYQPSLFQIGVGGRFRCPTCRREVALDRHGVYGLQRNLLVENIIDAYKQDSASSRPPPKPLAQLTCEEHDDEKLNIYCITCQVPTCSLCKVFGEHMSCQVTPLPDIYQQQKAELSDRVASLVSTIDHVQAFVNELEAMCTNIEENSRIQKQILCEKFDRMNAILEERRKIMTQQITSEQEEKAGWAQSLVQSYSGHVETNSMLRQTAMNAMEESEMAAFVQTSKDLIEKVGKASSCFTLETIEPGFEEMDHYKVNFDAEERMLFQLDFMNIEEEVEDTSDEPESELEPEPEFEPEPLSNPEPDTELDQDLKSEGSEMQSPNPETMEDTLARAQSCADIRKAICEKNGLSTQQTVTLLLYFLCFLVILQRIWGSIQCIICI
ncbi:tripartite motif-containing protein 54-like [Xyrauchen texanus]|uniref:tripartite motif-containing protein 54-like n=1 Tax=Xyrauchen texanus TaxID=154827 RepID=UPI0022418F39|nr:tripartite motif-containing protein 54-like [Xyrauchen texanus]XP_051961049.1 tripartite motif-containing protein 54-like [Xyrauchen texanus]